jgi:hypothetical protein
MAARAALVYKRPGRHPRKEQHLSRRNPCLLIAALAAGAAPAALAQAQRGSVEQVGSWQPVGMQQVAGRQPGAVADSAAPALQLTGERDARNAAPQLTSGPRSAQPSQPLSRPEDGRTGSVERVAGSDRCDPTAERPRAAACAQVIETRAAEFTRRDPTPLSPEQRITVEQRAREQGGGFGEAARRLAANGDDSNSLEAQGVASVVLRAPPAEPRPVKPDPDPAASAAMTAIVNAIVNAAPSP